VRNDPVVAVKEIAVPVRLYETEAMLSARPDVDGAMILDYGANAPVIVLVKPHPFCSGPELRDLAAISLGHDAPRIAVMFVPEIPDSEKGYPDPSRLIEGAPYVYCYEPPTTPTEQLLVTIWNDVLGRQRTGVLDDFLDLGGDSLRAVRLITHIHEKLGVPVDIAEFFDASSVRRVAAIIDAVQGMP
jgi:acyl carrier protein